MTHIFRLHDVEKYEYNFKRKPEYVHELKSVLMVTTAVKIFSYLHNISSQSWKRESERSSYSQLTLLHVPV